MLLVSKHIDISGFNKENDSPDIPWNTKKRNDVANDFEKDFKPMKNCIFGKIIETLKKLGVKLAVNQNLHQFIYKVIISNNLILI